MFIELPIYWKKKGYDEEEEVDFMSIDINEIYAFNSSYDGKTTIRTKRREESWEVSMSYDEFKKEFEALKEEVYSFVKTGLKI